MTATTYTLTVHGKYGPFTEQFNSLESARLRACALYGDLAVTIRDSRGNECRRYWY